MREEIKKNTKISENIYSLKARNVWRFIYKLLHRQFNTDHTQPVKHIVYEINYHVQVFKNLPQKKNVSHKKSFVKFVEGMTRVWKGVWGGVGGDVW